MPIHGLRESTRPRGCCVGSGRHAGTQDALVVIIVVASILAQSPRKQIAARALAERRRRFVDDAAKGAGKLALSGACQPSAVSTR